VNSHDPSFFRAFSVLCKCGPSREIVAVAHR
jgi:hypothetical protein